MPRIFISHIHEDKAAAKLLADFLRVKLGVQDDEFFLSSNKQIQLGSEWLASINEAFKGAIVVIALFSTEAMRRQWVHFEAGGAWFNKRKTLIPLCIGGLKIAQLDRPYCNLQAGDLHEWTTGHYLVTTIWKALRPETGRLPQLEYEEDDQDVQHLIRGLDQWKATRQAHVA